MWPAHWFLLTLGGIVPRLVNPTYAHSTLGLWQGALISAIMGLCLPCLGVVILVDWRLRPKHPDGEDAIDLMIGWASFALLPFVSFVLAALPALDAHTRLLVGTLPRVPRYGEGPLQERVRSTRSPLRLLGGRLEQLPQYLSYAPGSTTAVTDSVLLVYRDLR